MLGLCIWLFFQKRRRLGSAHAHQATMSSKALETLAYVKRVMFCCFAVSVNPRDNHKGSQWESNSLPSSCGGGEGASQSSRKQRLNFM